MSGYRTGAARPVVRALISAGVVLVLAVIGGFVYFAATLPPGQTTTSATTKADAIVVLTGARDRIAAAMRLLEAGRGARLLISGVNPEVSRDDLEALIGGPGTRFACCVDLGFEARTTDGNAAETALWAAENSYRSLIVVTSTYHMPRSLIVLSREMPGVILIPHPVAYRGGAADRAPGPLAAARLLVPEYAKYVITVLRARLS